MCTCTTLCALLYMSVKEVRVCAFVYQVFTSGCKRANAHLYYVIAC
jgi:hypothetical protein